MTPGGQAFKKPGQHVDDVEELAERDDVHVLTNRCPFCHDDIDVDAERWIACARCFARHHDACWGESGACGSCGGAQRLAPVREPVGLSPISREERAARGRLAAWVYRNSLLVITTGLLSFVALVIAMAFFFGGTSKATLPIVMGVLGGLLGALPIIIYAGRKARARKRAQREAALASQHARDGWQSYPVRYCSEARFNTLWKLFPWEATGIVSLSDQGVTLTTKTAAGGSVERRFLPQDTTIEWVGQKIWPNGALHWFVIEQDGERVYFTSDTGTTVVGSEASTREIYERLLTPKA